MNTTICKAATLLCALLLAAEASADSCARVSTFDSAPRTQQLFAAVLIAVDGELPGPTGATSWRIEPGKRVLKVAEAIEANRFSAPQNRDRDGRSVSNRYKTLEIDAQPGITYRLAVRFYPDRRNPMREGNYWEPVIWKETAEPCG